MAIAVTSSNFTGIEGVLTSVEVDITRGLPAFNLVGMADISVREAKERVRSAIINSGFEFPVSRITINLAPADIRKEGAHFDLPIAIGILSATGQINEEYLDQYIIVGELSLNGKINKIKGALPIIIEGCRQKIRKFIVPTENAAECSIVRDAEVFPFTSLNEVVHFLKYGDLLPYKDEELFSKEVNGTMDYNEVLGQESCKRALEVSAAGGHNILLIGPPGSGKTMLAQRLPTILPKLSYEEALEVTKIYSVSGKLNASEGLIKTRPFRNPHHTTTQIALIGGGTNLVPGEISLSHNGILFLDEILEFKKNVLELLRQPLEERFINISRVSGSVMYPANFMLVGALNPCPCGYFGSSSRQCTCTEHSRNRYLNRLSGPMLDRIDVFTMAVTPSFEEINTERISESSSAIRKRVERAREIQKHRFSKEGIHCNSQMGPRMIKKYCRVDEKTNKLISIIFNKYSLSTRAYSRILRLSRTIADLNEREKIDYSDVVEAIQYRKFVSNNIV